MLAVDAASGLIHGPHDGPETTWLAAVPWAAAETGFVGAGLALLAVRPFASHTRSLIGGAAAASLALFGLFRPAGAPVGVAVDASSRCWPSPDSQPNPCPLPNENGSPGCWP
jgi:hypothetical protein